MNALVKTSNETYRVEIQLFAGAREAIGSDTVSIDCVMPIHVSTLMQQIVRDHPVLEPFVTYGRLAIGNSFATQETVIEPPINADLKFALIPPVSGG